MPDLTYQPKVYREQNASALVVASGGTIRTEPGGVISGATATGSFVFATGEIESSDLKGNLASGTIPLGAHLFAARELASAETLSSGSTAPTLFFGGLLLSDTTPSLNLVSSGDQAFYLNWASANVDGIKLPPVAMPADLATAGGLSVDLFGESVGTATAADAKAAFDVRAWAGVGDTEMGATHPDFTSTPGWQTVSIASGDLTTNVLNLTLVPEAHAGRAIRLYDMRIRYTRGG